MKKKNYELIIKKNVLDENVYCVHFADLISLHPCRWKQRCQIEIHKKMLKITDNNFKVRLIIKNILSCDNVYFEILQTYNEFAKTIGFELFRVYR